MGETLFELDAPPAKTKRHRKRGYAAPPGSGPVGKRCTDCVHAHVVQSPSRRRFWKCRLVKQTHGPGTDILKHSPACSRFEQSPPEAKPGETDV